MRQLGNDVHIYREVIRQGGAHGLVVLHHGPIVYRKVAGGNDAHAVGTNFVGVLGQANGLVHRHCTHVDEHCNSSRSLFHNGLGHQFSLLRGHEVHLPRRSAGIQTLNALFNQVFCLLLQRRRIYLPVCGKGGSHGGDDTI